MLVLITTISFVALAAAVIAVAIIRTQRSALLSGGLLAVAGLIASLFAGFVSTSEYSPSQLAFLTNSFLVIAAVGANMFATAICANLKPAASALPQGAGAPPEAEPAPQTTPAAAASPSTGQQDAASGSGP